MPNQVPLCVEWLHASDVVDRGHYGRFNAEVSKGGLYQQVEVERNDCPHQAVTHEARQGPVRGRRHLNPLASFLLGWLEECAQEVLAAKGRGGGGVQHVVVCGLNPRLLQPPSEDIYWLVPRGGSGASEE